MQRRIRIGKTVFTLSVLVLVTACLVLVGWFFNIPFLKSVIPGFITMKANTAIGFVLFAGAVLRFRVFSKKKTNRILGFGMIGALALLSVATLFEYIFHRNLGIDEFFFLDPEGVTQNFPLGRLAPITAINFIALSLSLFLTENPWKRRTDLAQFLNFSVFLISMQALVAYLIGLKSIFGYAYYTQMALHTTVLFIFCSAAVTFLHPRDGFTAILLSRSAAGMMSRRFILVAIFLSPVILLLTTLGQKVSLFDENSSLLFRVTGTAAFLILIVWKTAEETFAVEKNLLGYKQRCDMILSSADMILFSVDLKGVFTFSEGNGLGRLGLKSGERVGQSIFKTHKDYPEVLSGVLKAMQDIPNQVRMHAHGVWVDCYFSPTRGAYDQLTGVVCLTVDVTEQVKIDSQLKESQERLSKVVKHAPVVIWSADENGILTLSDGSGLKGVGLLPGQLIGTSLREFCAEQKELLAGIDKAYEGNVVEVPSEYHGRFLEQVITPIFDEKRKVKGLVGLSIDVTSRKKADEERIKQEQLRLERDRAEESTRAKSIFLANMSHEIRTPIHGILGLNWLMMETTLTPEQHELATTIKNSSENLLRIVSDVLDFSKVEAGALQLENREFSLVEVLHQGIACVRIAAEKKGLYLRLKMEYGMPDLWMGDGGRIQQVITNLLANAVKFTSSGGVEIRVNLAARNTVNESIRIEVKDTGIGIPQSAKDHVFEAFGQADASTTRRFGGTGLGLSISKKYIEAMNGVIGFESRENEGSLFWFHIPLSRGVKCVPMTKLLSGKFIDEEKETSPSLKILVAEDNPVNQVVIYQMLQRMGHQAIVVNDGARALERLDAETFDLVLMDCQMPVMDGYEATRRIRTHSSEAVSYMPVIGLTADVLEANIDHCFAVGMTDVLTKPLTAAELKATLEKLNPGNFRDVS